MTQQIAILGATGSIGTSTLDILNKHKDKFSVYALSGFSRLDRLFELCQQFLPKRVAVAQKDVDAFATRLQDAGLKIEVVGGQAGLKDIAVDSQVDTVVASIVGSAGLESTLAAAQAGKRILLANKEALVMAGELMISAARHANATLLPVDSEHNAIFQTLPQAVQQQSENIHNIDYGIRQLWLTASGGPFLHSDFKQMQMATVEQAVAHPNWSMGQKISVDSATMMNKGLELIEACHLFNLPEDKIKVVMHPQSIIHSLVEYVDGSILSQMGSPDMRTPIAHCLAYPQRIESGVQRLDLYKMSQLEFLEPDLQKFACLRLARQAMQAGSWANISLNASNEVAVDAFLQKQISLTDIANINELVLEAMSTNANSANTINSLEQILLVDGFAREAAQTAINRLSLK